MVALAAAIFIASASVGAASSALAADPDQVVDVSGAAASAPVESQTATAAADNDQVATEPQTKAPESGNPDPQAAEPEAQMSEPETAPQVAAETELSAPPDPEASDTPLAETEAELADPVEIAALATPVEITPFAVPAGVSVVGTPCELGEGVTVVVDFTTSPEKPDEIDIRCVPQDKMASTMSIGQAFIAAGFELRTHNGAGTLLPSDPNPSFIDQVDGVWAFFDLMGDMAYWALYTSTTDRHPTGSPAADWMYSLSAINDGPVTTDQAYLLTYQWYDEDEDEWVKSDTGVLTLQDVLGPRNVAVATPPAYGAGDANAQRAAAWLGAQLAANGDVLPAKNGSTDWGLTIDAMLALASAGVGADQIQATAAKLAASGDAYVGTAAAPDWARMGKMVLALEVAGLDPTKFGSRDLVAELRAQVSASGAFGAGDLFSQPIAVIALARTPGGVPASSVGWMLTQQCTTGDNKGSFGWGCGAADADTTAMVVQALTAAGMPADDPVMVSAMAWLIGQQDATGGVGAWGLNTNTTGLVGQAFANIEATGSAAAASNASKFIGGLGISCDTVSANKALGQADVGAIAYDKTGWDDGLTSGLATAGGSREGNDANQSDEWWRATSQAVLGLGGPSLANLTAVGAERGLPQVTCPTPEPTAPATPGPGGSGTGGSHIGAGGAVVDLSALTLASAMVVIAVGLAALGRRNRVSR